MMIGRLEIVRGFYTKRNWKRYWRPKRLTLKGNPWGDAVYCWLGFNFGTDKKMGTWWSKKRSKKFAE
jgi:hypothetical protein